MAAPVGGGRSRRPRKQVLYESRREREFYRYYEPIRALSEGGPPLCNLHDDAAVKAHQPFSSPDRALTAFCQLGALRLGCRRAMLFFFDSNFAYVLAEATRTLSLVDDSVHEIEDELWLGHSVIPRGYSICEETVCRPPSDDSDHSPLHVINDLDEDATFCNRPYVTDGPKAKFYAGVPITTPKGINIGAYCLLDDRKREGLDAKGIAFLQDMATTVMTHLEMVRAKSEHERGTRMVCGLSAFVEGAASLQRSEQETERRDYRRVGRDATLSRPSQRSRVHSRRPEPDMKADVVGPSSATHSGTPSVTHSLDSVPLVDKPDVETGPSTPSKQNSSIPSRSFKAIRQATEDLRDQLVASNVRETFQRAATLVQEAVDVDGIIFLDASPNTFGGLVETHDSSDHSTEAVTSATDAGTTDGEARRQLNLKPSDKPCRVLASSHAHEHHLDQKGEPQPDIAANNVTERLLRSLLRGNPHGKIWNFNEEGDASSDDSSSEGSQRRSASRLPKASTGEHPDDSHTARQVRKRRSRIDDGKEIQRLFPGVRSLALCGMWDHNRGRWFSACIIWTYSPLRLFSPESEANYMAAFCDVIMAEMHRLEVQNADKAKADFISSISHELRSPLHGILGSVECLQDQSSSDSDSDSFSSGLVSQIEICSRTLLDIIDHLLDYSKINHHTKNQPLADGSAGVDAECALDEATEEVVETAVYSFSCSRAEEVMLERQVSVTLDIDRSAEVNWRCKVPMGGWKRICINLVSNALKYTSEGYVQVSLRAEPIPGKKKRTNAIFQVSDSGCGMSREFLENHLFRAFAQEDTLVEGTGLGLSLVAKIVKAMGGKIEVKSEKGVGTTTTVTIPIDVVRPSKEQHVTAALQAARTPFLGSSVAIVGFGDLDSTAPKDSTPLQDARAILSASIQRNCKRLELDVAVSGKTADACIITEQDLTYDDPLKKELSDKPLIVICRNAVSVRRMRATRLATMLTTQRIEYIAQPCGIERLSKAARSCLQVAPSLRELSTSAEDRWTTDVDSGIVTRPDCPHEHGDVEPRSKDPSFGDEQTPRSPSNVNSVPYSPHPGPPWPSGRRNVSVRNNASLVAPEAEDYLSIRSKSSGDAPISPHVMTHVPLKKSPIQSGADGVTSSGLSLLLVDDNQINLQLLVNYAKKQGHTKQTATDGMQAVQTYKQACLGSVDTTLPLEKPQVILMDINMPILNGFEATRHIRAFEQQHDLRPAHIIALTGLGSASAQQEAFNSGVDLFLTKPVRLKELTKLLAEVQRAEEERRAIAAGGNRENASG